MNKIRLDQLHDIEVIVESASSKTQNTINVFDLDDLLEALKGKHPVDAFFIRRKLVWVMKRAHKDLGVVCKNPWWTPKSHR